MKIQFWILIIMFVLAPVLIIYLEGKYKVVKKIGAVLICYALGLIIGNIGILPEGSYKYQNLLNTISIPTALPLILFSLDVKKWFKLAGKAVTSLFIGLFSVLLMIFIGHWIFKGTIDNIWQVSGMLVGMYTGGTPNMAAITTALNASQELFILTNTYEIALGAVYLIFILSAGQRVLLWILPPFKSSNEKQIDVEKLNLEYEFESYEGIFKKNIFFPLLGALGISIAISGVSYGLSMLFPEEYAMAVVILFITSLGISFSFIPGIKKIKKTFQLGMYFILIFCLAASSTADISKLSNISFSLFYFVGLAMFGSHILHVFIARLFKIDADTVIISGVALICSPPFVPVAAGAIKNREVILTGLMIGISGYAIGNYLGVMVAYILK